MNRTVTCLGALLLAATAASGPVLAQDILTGTPEPEAEAAPAPEATAPIALTSPDVEIRRRLLQLYREIDGLENVRVEVRAGVVTLSGTTLDAAASDEAEAVASRLTGVVAVENELAAEHRLERRLEPLVAKSRSMLESAIAFLPVLAIALLAFIAFWVAGTVFTRRTNVFRRIAPNPFIEQLFEQVVRLLFVLAGLVVAMNILGATAMIGSVLGAAGVFGLAIGFATRDTIENYIASILLSVRRPFAPNDAVLIEGVEGRVTTLNSRATIITTWDGNEVRIPNSIVYKSKILNYTHTPERRFSFEIRISMEDPVSCALAIAIHALKQVEGVLEQPGPQALVDRIEEYAVVLKILGWVDQKHSDFNKVRSEAIRAVKEAFEAEHIDITGPVQTIRQMPEADDEPQPAPREPTSAEMREIKDTSADTTIAEKVQERREQADNDLLTTAAPRE